LIWRLTDNNDAYGEHMFKVGASIVVAVSLIGCAAQSTNRGAYVGIPAPAELSAALAAATADTAQATHFCSAFIGRQVAPQPFDIALKQVAKVPPKDEFETTEQYSARLAAGSQDLQSLIIAKEVEDYKYLAYDADRQKLVVRGYAFDNRKFNPSRIFAAANAQEPRASTLGNIDILIGETDTSLGSYIGTNAFGALVRIDKVLRSTKAIFQGSASELIPSIFVAQSMSGVIGEIAMTPDVARSLKSKLKIALVVKPKAPFIVRASYPDGEPTFDSPKDVEVNATVLIADIQCGLLLDHRSEVIGSYVAQGAKRIQPPPLGFERNRKAMGL